MQRLTLLLAISLIFTTPLAATTYYVSPGGNDGNSGLSSGEAWAAIDNGDRLGVLQPGDSVLVLPGSYVAAASYELTSSGTSLQPIVYCKYGSGAVLIDGGTLPTGVVRLTGDYLIVDGLEVTGGNTVGVDILSDHCVVKYCHVHDSGARGIRVTGTYNTLLRNTISNTGVAGIEVGSEYNYSYNNTLYGCGTRGIHYSAGVTEGRIFNNICAGNSEGIRAKATVICGFNCLWSNTLNYTNTVVDSAGGIAADPRFVNAAAQNFDLQSNSPCIDAGLDLGYPYAASAPDMGAYELIEGADLELSNLVVEPSTIGGSRSFSVCSFTLSNNGPENILAAVVAFDFYLSENGSYGDDEVKIGTYSTIISLGPGGIQNFYLSGLALIGATSTWPADQPCGDYYVYGNIRIVTALTNDNYLFNNYARTNNSISYTGCPVVNVDLEVTKSADTDTSFVGSEVYYKITVQNHGPSTATGVEVTDILPAGLTFERDSALAGSYTEATGVWDIGTIAAGSGTGLYLFATVDPGTKGTKILNTASITDYNQTDTDAGNNTADYSISIINRAPQLAAIDDQTMFEGNHLAFTVSATDADGDAITLAATGLPQHATLVDNGDGTGEFEFQADATQAGVYTVKFIASDGDLADTLSVTITVNAKNFAPQLNTIGPKTVEVGNSLAFSATASDPDGTIPTLSAEDLPANAGFTDNGDGTGGFSFVPQFGQAGIYTVRFIASDGILADSEIVQITVVEDNVPPVLDPIGDQTVVEGDLLAFTVTASDANTSTPSISAENLPAGATLTDNNDGTADFSFSPSYSQAGSYAVLFIADDGLVADSEAITIVVYPAPVVRIAVTPDSATITADSTLQYSVRGYDAGNVEDDPGDITWSLTAAVGTIDPTGLFTPASAGNARVVARSDLGLVDTTALLAVIPGAIARLKVTPDSVQITIAKTGQFTAIAFDADSNLVADVTATADWSTTDPQGSVVQGLYTAGLAASPPGYFVRAESAGVADSAYVEVLSGVTFDKIVVTPDTATLQISDALLFHAIGIDDFGQPTEISNVSWEVLGGIGEIDADGHFTATTRGYGRVRATTSDSLASDLSNLILVEVPAVSATPLGNQFALPAGSGTPVLAFDITNQFAISSGFSGLTIRQKATGTTNANAVAADLDSLVLWRDLDLSATVSSGDQRIAAAPVGSAITSFSFSAVPILPYTQSRYLIAAGVSLFPRDNDTLDFFFLPATDVTTSDATPIAGQDTLNSLGRVIVDGMIAQQVAVGGIGNRNVESDGTLHQVMTIDIPRNGYEQDTLRQLSVVNQGSGGETDVDSLILFRDNGDLVWSGSALDQQVGAISYTGELWSTTGLAVPLTAQSNRFFILLKLAEFPTDGSTFALAVPERGIEVASRNDGPIDQMIESVDTVTVLSNKSVSIQALNIAPRTLIPGSATGPLVKFRVTNGTPNSLTLNRLDIRAYLSDPRSATQAQLESQVDSAVLYIKVDGNDAAFGGDDQYLKAGVMSGGAINFDGLGLILPQNGGSLTLAAGLYLDPLNCRDGNTVNLGIEGSTAIEFATATTLEGDFPIKNNEGFTLNAFPASAIKINPVAGKTLYPGQRNVLVLDFELPRNGYASDRLRALTLQQLGTQSSFDALAAVKLYADAGAAGFSGDDTYLGSFTRNGGTLRLTNLNQLVAQQSNRFLVTVDISDGQFSGGNFDLQITAAGATYSSGMTGPDDSPVSNPDYHLLLPSERITAVAIPVESKLLYPGSTNNVLLSFALYNGYAELDQTLESIRFTNLTESAAGEDFGDEEIGLLSLYLDQSSDGKTTDDPLLATGSFGDGRLQMSGLDINLSANALLYFVVVADISESAIDSDQLQISVESGSDLTFTDAVNINGDLPLTTVLPFTIDGSIASQYEIRALNPRTLVTGQDTVSLFALSAATNGILPDVLTSFTIENMGTATQVDFESLSLWHDDNNNGLREASDTRLGDLQYNNGRWSISGIAPVISQASANLFVVGNIADNAVSGHTIRFRLPVGGAQYVSNNDGPLDKALPANYSFTISDSPLQISYSLARRNYTVGQEIGLTATVKNTSSSALDAVFVDLLTTSNPELVSTEVTHAGPFTFAASESRDVAFPHLTLAPGSVDWTLQAYSAIGSDSSIVLTTDPVDIFSVSPPVAVRMINSIPNAVTVGQTHVFPFSIRYALTEPTASAAPARLDSITISVTKPDGTPLAANECFARVVLSNGYEPLSVVEQVPATSELTLRFTRSLLLSGTAEGLLALRVDIGEEATASAFKLALADASAIYFADDNSDVAISIVAEGGFPLVTPSCEIDTPSDAMAVSAAPLLNQYVNFGQQSVKLISLDLRHPGEVGESRVQLTGLRIRVEDQAGDPLNISSIMDEVALVSDNQVIGKINTSTIDTESLTLNPFAPPVIFPGSTREVILCATISESPFGGGFKVIIDDSTAFEFRDLSSGSLVEATADTLVLSTGLLFPISSGTAEFKCPASDPEVCVNAPRSASVIAGATAVDLVTIEVGYPAAGDCSQSSLSQVNVSFFDREGRALDPSKLFDQIGCRKNDGNVAYQSFVELSGGDAVFRTDNLDLALNPGESYTLTLVADLEANIPYDHFKIGFEQSAFRFADVTDPSNQLGVSSPLGCAAEFPVASDEIAILLPAGKPVLSWASKARVSFAGEQTVTAFAGTLLYNGPTPLGDLLLQSLHGSLMLRTSDGYAPTNLAEVFQTLTLQIGGTTALQLTEFSGSDFSFALTAPYELNFGGETAIALLADLQPAAASGSYAIQFEDSTFVSIIDKQLGGPVYPLLSATDYPLRGSELSLTSAGLAESFTNYPNPFYPDRGDNTTIAFVLPQPGIVHLRVYTITGELVETLIDGQHRAAGAYQIDSWDGANSRRNSVIPGTYFCRLNVQYDSGASETVTRKVAVIR